MRTRPKPAAAVARLNDGPAVPAELIFVAMVALLAMLLALAGVPLAPEKTVGDGSPALRKGWLEQRQAESLASSSTPASGVDDAALRR